MSEMGIFTIYPPREDVVVGDVYALPLHPYDSAAVGYIGGLGTAGIHVSYLGDTNMGWPSILTSLNNYYRSRPYPADTLAGGTNAASETTPLTSIPSFAESGARDSVFGGGSTARFRQVAFPDFSVSTVSQSSLSAVVPIEGIMAGFQFGYNDIKAVHFKISQAESVGLTTEELMKDLYASDSIRTLSNNIYLDASATNGIITYAGGKMAYAMFEDIFKSLANNPDRPMPASIKAHLRESAGAMKDHIYLALISEVFYARSIDITIDHKRASSTGVSAKPISTDELNSMVKMGLTKPKAATTNTATASGTNSFTPPKAEMIDLTEGDSALDLARRLRGIEPPSGVQNIGGSVKVLRVSSTSIGLRRTFERPIAVGVRGVIVRVNVRQSYKLPDSPGRAWMQITTN
jgi:hypothetical protein